jgi:hypothetical protein
MITKPENVWEILNRVHKTCKRIFPCIFIIKPSLHISSCYHPKTWNFLTPNPHARGQRATLQLGAYSFTAEKVQSSTS